MIVVARIQTARVHLVRSCRQKQYASILPLEQLLRKKTCIVFTFQQTFRYRSPAEFAQYQLLPVRHGITHGTAVIPGHEDLQAIPLQEFEDRHHQITQRFFRKVLDDIGRGALAPQRVE